MWNPQICKLGMSILSTLNTGHLRNIVFYRCLNPNHFLLSICNLFFIKMFHTKVCFRLMFRGLLSKKNQARIKNVGGASSIRTPLMGRGLELWQNWTSTGEKNKIPRIRLTSFMDDSLGDSIYGDSELEEFYSDIFGFFRHINFQQTRFCLRHGLYYTSNSSRTILLESRWWYLHP